MTITKEIKFDCAHMLSNYLGKCANLHGHTYHGRVTIHGEIDAETYMLLDYNKIKEVVDVFDHAVIFSAQENRTTAENKLQEWAVDYGMKYVILRSGKSTAECMAQEICTRFTAFLPIGTNIIVCLSETDGSFAEATTCVLK